MEKNYPEKIVNGAKVENPSPRQISAGFHML